MTVGWVVRASSNLPSQGSGLTCPPRATATGPAAVSPIAFGSRATDAITRYALNVLPTELLRGTPRTCSWKGAVSEYQVPACGGWANPMAELKPGACAHKTPSSRGADMLTAESL